MFLFVCFFGFVVVVIIVVIFVVVVVSGGRGERVAPARAILAAERGAWFAGDGGLRLHAHGGRLLVICFLHNIICLFKKSLFIFF